MVVLAIMGVILGIAGPSLVGYTHLAQFRENETHAKTLYLAAESTLTHYRSNGTWDRLKNNITANGTKATELSDPDLEGRIYGLRLDKNEYGSAQSPDGVLCADLLEATTYDKTLLNQSINVEVDVETGHVYSVFYSSTVSDFRYKSEAGTGDKSYNMERRDYNTRKKKRVGYFSVDDSGNVVDLETVKLKVHGVQIINDEMLTLSWSSNSRHQDLDVQFKIAFYEGDSSQNKLLMNLELDRSELVGFTGNGVVHLNVYNAAHQPLGQYAFPLTYEQGVFSLSLDAMMSAKQLAAVAASAQTAPLSSTSITRFASVSEKFKQPMDISATIQAVPTYRNNDGDTTEYQESEIVPSNVENTMFGKVDQVSKTIDLKTFRHLYNIRFMNPFELWHYRIQNDMNWMSGDVQVYQSVGGVGAIAPLHDPAFPSIERLSPKQKLTAKNTIAHLNDPVLSNLKLDDTSIAGDNLYFGLVCKNEGEISNVTLHNPSLVTKTQPKLRGAGLLCGKSSGTLKDCEITGETTKVDAVLTSLDARSGVGGVVGLLEVRAPQIVQNLSVEGTVTGVLPVPAKQGKIAGGELVVSDNKRGVGGIAGVLEICQPQGLSGCVNLADVKGNYSTGGIAGHVYRDPATIAAANKDIDACDNYGLVLCSAANDLAAPQGHYIGGIVGYGEFSRLNACSSASGRDKGTVPFDKDRRGELLRGRYVGGIMGYGKECTIKSCTTEKKGYIMGDSYVGGIIGGLEGEHKNGLPVEGQEINGISITTNASFVIGNDYVGGIVGANTGNSKIENCINEGVAVGYGRFIGGICGYNAGAAGETPSIVNCSSYVSDIDNSITNLVKSWDAKGDYVGGLVGYNRGQIKFVKAQMQNSVKSIAGIIVGENFVGGVVGLNDETGTIEVDYELMRGKVMASGDYVGGMIGMNNSTAILGQTYTINADLIEGRYFVGGVIGANIVEMTSDITASHLNANNELGKIVADGFCGGVIGYHRSIQTKPAGGTLGQSIIKSRAGTLPKADFLPTVDNDFVADAGQAAPSEYILKLNYLANDMDIATCAYGGGIIGYSHEGSKLIVVDCANRGSFTKRADPVTNIQGVNLASYLEKRGYRPLDGTELVGQTHVNMVGGIVGVNGKNQVIDHCTNYGVMRGFVGLGGITGFNGGLVKRCMIQGSVGSGEQDYVGGIVGINGGWNTVQNQTVGTYTFDTGRILSCNLSNKEKITGRNAVGGLVGYNMAGAEIESSKSSANVNGTNGVGGYAGENAGVITIQEDRDAANVRKIIARGRGAGGIAGIQMANGTLEIQPDASNDGKHLVAVGGGLEVKAKEAAGGLYGVNRGTAAGTAPQNDAQPAVYLTSMAKRVTAENYAGGLIGMQDSTTGVVSYCRNLSREVTTEKGYAGGIVGLNPKGCTIEQSLNGDLTGELLTDTYIIVRANAGYAGGIASQNFGTIKNCAVEKTTISSAGVKDQANYIGTLCAVNEEGAKITMEKTNMPRQKVAYNVQMKGDAKVGGVVAGLNRGTISDGTTNDQSFYSVSAVLSFETTAKDAVLGGVVGANGKNGLVRNLTSKISITDNGVENTPGVVSKTPFTYVGGIAGQNNGTIRNCKYEDSSITETHSKKGNCYGGITGYNVATVEECSAKRLKLSAIGTYTAISTSTAAEKEKRSSHIGGVVGKNETGASVVNCYIDQCTNAEEVGEKWNYGISTKNGMVGGIVGFNKGSITDSGDAQTAKKLAVSAPDSTKKLLTNQDNSVKAKAAFVNWQDNKTIDQLKYSDNSYVAISAPVTIVVRANGNLGGIAGYNAPTGTVQRCANGEWFLVNESQSIGVGTGGIIGMNEGEGNLDHLVNRAFVGRYLKNGATNRFAGGVIGIQSNKTTTTWEISDCTNYGSVYCYNAHYAGGIIGQWTDNGGTVENCRNYGNLQTTYQASYKGAAAGIVAQLYHASEGQNFDVISCENHGDIFGRTGKSGKECANDSAGILGNVTTFDNGRAFQINVIDCVNGKDAEIYSNSIATGMVAFLSADTSGTIAESTRNIILNIDRCRNYSTDMKGQNPKNSGIFGDRYGNAADTTYIQNCFSVNVNNYPIAWLQNLVNSSGTNDKLVGNNFYFDGAEECGTVNRGGNSVDKPNLGHDHVTEAVKTGTRKVYYMKDQNGKWFAAQSGIKEPLIDIGVNVGSVERMTGFTTSNSYMDTKGDLYGRVDRFGSWSKKERVGRCLFELNEIGPQVFLQDSNGDQYVQGYYQRYENTGAQLSNPESVTMKPQANGTFDVTIQDTNRPLYYRGALYLEGSAEPILTGLRFVPTQKNASGGKWTTTDHFRLPDELANDPKLKNANLIMKVSAVSAFEGVADSEWIASVTVNNKPVLPTPQLRVTQTGKTEFMLSLENLSDYAAFSGWKVELRSGSGKVVTLNAGKPATSIAAEDMNQYTVTVTGGAEYAQLQYSLPMDLPSGGYPDASLKEPTVSISGNTIKDLKVAVGIAVNETSVDVPPIYRVELLGAVQGKEIVFAQQDVLSAAGHQATAVFTDLPNEMFTTATDLKARAWYAQSGLGPVYTYVPLTAANTSVGLVTMRKYDQTGNFVDTYLDSATLRLSTGFKNYIKSVNLGVHTLPTPVLEQTLTPTTIGDEVHYTFEWDKGKTGTDYSDASYQVELIGIRRDGQNESYISIPLDASYANTKEQSMTVNAGDWQFDAVRLEVTRIGTASKIGLTGSYTYDVEKRLETPEVPGVIRKDNQDLVYQFSWNALGSEAGCASYEIYGRVGGVEKLLKSVPAAGQTDYTVDVDLNDYAGAEAVEFYLVAKAQNGTNYIDSNNGTAITIKIPARLPQPALAWTFNWKYNDLEYLTMKQFTNSGMTVTVTPTAATKVPAGSSFLLYARIYEDVGGTQELGTYPALDPGAPDVIKFVSMEARQASGGTKQYVQSLAPVPAEYAGKYIRFYTRISSGDSQAASLWKESEMRRLPYVRLDPPEPTRSDELREIDTLLGTKDDFTDAADQKWSGNAYMMKWLTVPQANVYTMEITSYGAGNQIVTTPVRIFKGTPTDPDAIRVEVQGSGGWHEVTPTAAADGTAVYELVPNQYIVGSYTRSDVKYYYKLKLATTLSFDAASQQFTLRLPNLKSVKNAQGIPVTDAAGTLVTSIELGANVANNLTGQDEGFVASEILKYDM